MARPRTGDLDNEERSGALAEKLLPPLGVPAERVDPMLLINWARGV